MLNKLACDKNSPLYNFEYFLNRGIPLTGTKGNVVYVVNFSTELTWSFTISRFYYPLN